ncbi:G-protein alpha subunit-domain-containing protein [Mycena haematopus]|nr:G-protein alpha subunit-domain-containing protein [Mycena haematopus]
MRYFAPLTRLWGQDVVRTAWARGNEAAVPENLEYFFSALPRLFDPAYVPTEQDIVRARARTIGITETAFTLRGTEMLMVDVRGVASKTSLRRHAVRSSSCSSFFLLSFRGGVPTRPIESHAVPSRPRRPRTRTRTRTRVPTSTPACRPPDARKTPARRPHDSHPRRTATPLASRSRRPPRASTCAAVRSTPSCRPRRALRRPTPPPSGALATSENDAPRPPSLADVAHGTHAVYTQLRRLLHSRRAARDEFGQNAPASRSAHATRGRPHAPSRPVESCWTYLLT